MPKKLSDKTRLTKSDAESVLRAAGMQVNDFARYVDTRGMVRLVARKTGEFGVKNAGWREVSRREADEIQRANAALNRGFLKPKGKKYF